MINAIKQFMQKKWEQLLLPPLACTLQQIFCKKYLAKELR